MICKYSKSDGVPTKDSKERRGKKLGVENSRFPSTYRAPLEKNKVSRYSFPIVLIVCRRFSHSYFSQRLFPWGSDVEIQYLVDIEAGMGRPVKSGGDPSYVFLLGVFIVILVDYLSVSLSIFLLPVR